MSSSVFVKFIQKGFLETICELISVLLRIFRICPFSWIVKFIAFTTLSPFVFILFMWNSSVCSIVWILYGGKLKLSKVGSAYFLETTKRQESNIITYAIVEGNFCLTEFIERLVPKCQVIESNPKTENVFRKLVKKFGYWWFVQSESKIDFRKFILSVVTQINDQIYTEKDLKSICSKLAQKSYELNGIVNEVIVLNKYVSATENSDGNTYALISCLNHAYGDGYSISKLFTNACLLNEGISLNDSVRIRNISLVEKVLTYVIGFYEMPYYIWDTQLGYILRRLHGEVPGISGRKHASFITPIETKTIKGIHHATKTKFIDVLSSAVSASLVKHFDRRNPSDNNTDEIIPGSISFTLPRSGEIALTNNTGMSIVRHFVGNDLNALTRLKLSSESNLEALKSKDFVCTYLGLRYMVTITPSFLVPPFSKHVDTFVTWSNLPGTDKEVYLNTGHRLLYIGFMANIGNIGVTIGFFSYNGFVSGSYLVDDAVANKEEVEEMVQEFNKHIKELEKDCDGYEKQQM